MVEAAAAKVNEKKKEILQPTGFAECHDLEPARRCILEGAFWRVELGNGSAHVVNEGADSAWRCAPVVAVSSVVGPGVVKAGQGVVVCSGADEGVAAARDAVAEEVPDDGADARVEGVLEKHVAHVLVAHRACLEGCKTGLHQEDQAAREQDVEGVHLLLGHPQIGCDGRRSSSVGGRRSLQVGDGRGERIELCDGHGWILGRASVLCSLDPKRHQNNPQTPVRCLVIRNSFLKRV